MNERIKELAHQSGISILWEYDGYDGHAGVCNLDDIEKFAELLTTECGKIIQELSDDYMDAGRVQGINNEDITKALSICNARINAQLGINR